MTRKIHIAKPSAFKAFHFFTSIAQVYINTVIIYRSDRLSLQSDMSSFYDTDSVFYGKYVRKAVLFISGSGNEVETIGERRREHFARTPSCVLWYTI